MGGKVLHGEFKRLGWEIHLGRELTALIGRADLITGRRRLRSGRCLFIATPAASRSRRSKIEIATVPFLK